MNIVLVLSWRCFFAGLTLLTLSSCLTSPTEEAVGIDYQVKEDYRAAISISDYRGLYPQENTVPITLFFEQELLTPIFDEMSEGGVNTVYPFLRPGQQALYKLTELRAFMEDIGIIGYLRSPAGSKTEELRDILMQIGAEQILPQLDEVLKIWEVEGWKNKALPNIRMESDAIDFSGISSFEKFYFEHEPFIQERMLQYLKKHPEDFIQIAVPDSLKAEQVDTI
ncbi:MAG: DUF4375 domain-containing protein [Bacteroidota bacterium]